MKILWLSNSPLAPSGYGEQTALFTERLRNLGHDVSIAANFGIAASVMEWRGMVVLPAQESWGNPSLGTFAKHTEADWVICLNDAWVMAPDKWPDVKMALWCPIDHYPVPPRVLKVLMNDRVRPIAMSRFGEEWLNKFKLDPLYVPHGVDTSVFRPRPEHKSLARRALSIPDGAFLVGMVAANRGWSPHAPRKSFPQAFDAFARFAKRHDDAYLYVHAEAQPNGPPGIDLVTLSKAVGVPEDRVAFPPPEAWHLMIMDKQFISGAYSAMDVLLNPSMSEGFGVPIVEAQACGVPVIVSNHSSMPELVGAGWIVEGDRWWDAAQDSFAIIPSIQSIEDALEDAYASRDDATLPVRAVEFAAQYDADLVTEQYWKPALEELDRPRVIPPLHIGAVPQGEPIHESRQVRRARERRESKVQS
jgi:glycosyltransferase involved in cell wall biosynthesis